MTNFNSISFAKKVSLTLFVLVVCGLQTLQAQTVSNSTCFTFSVTSTSTTCSTNNCDDPPGNCNTNCYEVTVTNTGCSGLTINALTMTTPGDQVADCRSVCSPSGDFNVSTDTYNPFTDCSWAGPRYLTYIGNGGNGLAYLGTAKFVICRKETGSITYTFSCGCSCSGTPCTNATITF